MALQYKYNAIEGTFDLVDVVDTTTFVGKETLTGQTTDNLPTPIGFITPDTDTYTRYKAIIKGLQIAGGTEGAEHNKYAFEVEFGAQNIGGVLTLSNISGVTNEEDTALPQDVDTFNACTVSVSGVTNVSFGIEALLGIINWTIEITKV